LLTKRSYQEFATFFNVIGGSCLNPLDVSWNSLTVDELMKSLNILSRDENIDALVLELCLPFAMQLWEYDPTYFDNLREALVDFRTRHDKCFSIVVTAGQLEVEAVRIRQKLIERGLASFPTFQRAARALRKIVDYHRFQWDGR
jgi:acyl-CoA synthetase (NDP forming)